jgi:hypothetical protein
MTDGCVHLLYNSSWKFHQLAAGQLLSGQSGTVRKRQAVRPGHHVQSHTCRVTLLQPARRAAVLGQPSSYGPHWLLDQPPPPKLAGSATIYLKTTVHCSPDSSKSSIHFIYPIKSILTTNLEWSPYLFSFHARNRTGSDCIPNGIQSFYSIVKIYYRPVFWRTQKTFQHPYKTFWLIRLPLMELYSI